MRASVITKTPAQVKHEYVLNSTGDEELDEEIWQMVKQTMDDMIHGVFMTGKTGE